jgi:hypothetical protein
MTALTMLTSHLSPFRFFSRFVRDAGLGCTERFIHTMDLFFKAVAQQSADRTSGSIPDLESYVYVRRDTSGCKPCFALIEYAAGIDLPDEVINHPTVRALEEATNDLVTWSNVCHLRLVCRNFICATVFPGYILVQRRAVAKRYTQHDSNSNASPRAHVAGSRGLCR